VEYVCKQLYILHRKPFLLQMFGSVAPILDREDKESQFGDASKVSMSGLMQGILTEGEGSVQLTSLY
jgi:hypothetical protein